MPKRARRNAAPSGMIPNSSRLFSSCPDQTLSIWICIIQLTVGFFAPGAWTGPCAAPLRDVLTRADRSAKGSSGSGTRPLHGGRWFLGGRTHELRAQIGGRSLRHRARRQDGQRRSATKRRPRRGGMFGTWVETNSAGTYPDGAAASIAIAQRRGSCLTFGGFWPILTTPT